MNSAPCAVRVACVWLFIELSKAIILFPVCLNNFLLGIIVVVKAVVLELASSSSLKVYKVSLDVAEL